MTLKQVEAQAMQLRPKQRARLASRLLSSLSELPQSEIDALWAEEAARRDAEADADPSVDLPVDQVLREARELLR